MKAQNTFGISFLVRRGKTDNGKVYIYASIRVNSKRIEMSLKHSIDANNWNANKGQGIGNHPDIIRLNQYLLQVKSRLVECYRELQLDGEIITAELVKKKFIGEVEDTHTLLKLVEYHNKTMDGILAPGTLKNYYTTVKYLKSYINKRYRLSDSPLKKLSYQFITDFEHFLRSHKPLNHHNPIGNNGIMKHLERFRKIVTMGARMEWIDKDPFTHYKLKFKKPIRVFLTGEELTSIELKQLFIPRLKYVRDLFVFSCYTGLSYIDAIQLKPDDISIGIDGEHWIFIKRQKTDEPVRIPIYGSVVVVKKPNNYEVVDGQQRLTTLTILFCTLRDLNLDLTQKNIISNSIKDLVESKERLKLTTHLNNQALFEESVLKGINFNSTKKELSDNRFLQTAFYFKDLILKAQDDTSEDFVQNFGDFIEYLFNKTTMIRIVCFDEGFAIKLFTVLNDRGLDLTPADIIKAYLLQNLSDEIQRNSFTEVWKRIENTCKLSGESLQGIFNLYLYYLKNENPKRALQDELKEQFKSKNPQSVILDIEKFANNILEINSANKDKDISMLKYLRQTIYWKSILATAKQVDYPNYKELKSLITKYFYQSWIANGTSNRIKQTSFNILKKVKNKENIAEIQDLITENLDKYDHYLDFLNNENAYWTNWHKPLLLSIEYYQQDEKDFVSISRDLHTEHILPKEWNRDDLNWTDSFTEETAKPLLNSLGNLTLLSGTKNIQASNRNYADKTEIYKGNNGKGFDGKTSFEITKSVIDNYPTWTTETISERYKWLLSETKRIFDI